jgi:hypothetical protein
MNAKNFRFFLNRIFPRVRWWGAGKGAIPNLELLLNEEYEMVVYIRVGSQARMETSYFQTAF